MHDNRSQHEKSSHYQARTIGNGCYPIVRLLPGAVVRWDVTIVLTVLFTVTVFIDIICYICRSSSLSVHV